MKTLGLVVVTALATIARGVLAGEDNPQSGAKAVPARPGAPRALPMTDRELDRVVAGKAIQVETGFNTWIVNPGNAMVGKVHKDGSFTCINLCGLPPPPPPPGGGGGGN
jgi:hypothetical protein